MEAQAVSAMWVALPSAGYILNTNPQRPGLRNIPDKEHQEFLEERYYLLPGKPWKAMWKGPSELCGSKRGRFTLQMRGTET